MPVWRIRVQARNRIDRKRKWLPVDGDLLDRISGNHLVLRRQREDRLALVHGLVGQRELAGNVRFFAAAPATRQLARQVVDRENGMYTRRPQRFTRVEGSHARM